MTFRAQEVRIMEYIKAHPDSVTAEIREGVGDRGWETDWMIQNLCKAGLIVGTPQTTGRPRRRMKTWRATEYGLTAVFTYAGDRYEVTPAPQPLPPTHTWTMTFTMTERRILTWFPEHPRSTIEQVAFNLRLPWIERREVKRLWGRALLDRELIETVNPPEHWSLSARGLEMVTAGFHVDPKNRARHLVNMSAPALVQPLHPRFRPALAPPGPTGKRHLPHALLARMSAKRAGVADAKAAADWLVRELAWLENLDPEKGPQS